MVMSNKQLLGELLISEGLVSQDTIQIALRVQVSGNRRLGHILVKMKAITADQLAEVLAKQLGTPIIQINEKFSSAVKNILPRYLCQQYGVLPLSLQANNILEVAMANPADNEAISDIESYTDKVVQPYLARNADINREIKRKIPLTSKDFLAPIASTWVTRSVATVALILVFSLGFFTFDYVKKARYGVISETATHTLYKNHDLILGVENNGKLTLLGRGAFSKGYYSVSFDNPNVLNAFIQSKEKDFSEEQRTWLSWAMEQAGAPPLQHTVAVIK